VKTYLVFESAGGGRNAEAADRVVFLREKFAWLALFFAVLWLLWHRLWLGFALWLLAVVLIAGVVYALDLNPPSAMVALMIPSLVLAFEGTELRRRKLLRSGYRDAGVAVGRDLEDAERRFFEQWAAQVAPRPEPGAAPRAAAPVVPAQPPSSARPVIGLFPEPGGGR
jgi:hypothetical protein